MKLKGIPIKGIQVKDGKLEKKFHYRDASHKIRCRKSKKISVRRRVI